MHGIPRGGRVQLVNPWHAEAWALSASGLIKKLPYGSFFIWIFISSSISQKPKQHQLKAVFSRNMRTHSQHGSEWFQKLRYFSVSVGLLWDPNHTMLLRLICQQWGLILLFSLVPLRALHAEPARFVYLRACACCFSQNKKQAALRPPAFKTLIYQRLV